MIDLQEIRDKWLGICGYCDAGQSMACTCAHGDPRVLISELVTEIERLAEHSTTLNTIGWKMAEALGHVPSGTQCVQGDVVELTDRLIGEMMRSRLQVPMHSRQVARESYELGREVERRAHQCTAPEAEGSVDAAIQGMLSENVRLEKELVVAKATGRMEAMERIVTHVQDHSSTAGDLWETVRLGGMLNAAELLGWGSE